ncbi:PepSY domain-containing protein [Nitrospira sp. CMX1]
MTNKTFTMWRTILIAGIVIGLAGIVGEMIWNADNGQLKRVELIGMATSTKITIDEAVEKALENIVGQVIVAELEKRGGMTIWNVEILTTEEAIVAISIDAVSGSVLISEEKAVGKRLVHDKTS